MVTISTTPATVSADLAKAKPGDRVLLTAGDYGAQVFSGLSFSPAITLDARKATVTFWQFRDCTGVHILGGTWKTRGVMTAASAFPVASACILAKACADFTVDQAQFIGPEVTVQGEPYQIADGYGVQFIGGSRAEVTRSAFTAFKVGVVVGAVDGFVIAGNSFDRMRADGIDATGWNGLIEENDAYGFHRLGAEHPDGIQIWSATGQKPTSDIVIRRNTIMGDCQGINGFDHGTGGFDRITITDNDISILASQAVCLVAARDSEVSHNRVRTLPCAPYRASVNTDKSPGIRRFENKVGAGAGKASADDAPLPSPGAGR